jgi:hypothetical protein
MIFMDVNVRQTHRKVTIGKNANKEKMAMNVCQDGQGQPMSFL